jgi:hypothetical protein
MFKFKNLGGSQKSWSILHNKYQEIKNLFKFWGHQIIDYFKIRDYLHKMQLNERLLMDKKFLLIMRNTQKKVIW